MHQVIGPVMSVDDLMSNPDIDNIVNEYEGFVYMITSKITGKQYIGKKTFKSTTNKKLGKKEIAALPVTRGRTPKKKKVIKESDWRNYFGSNKNLLEEIKEHGIENYIRSVLRLCKTKKDLTYWETKHLFTNSVLEDDRYYNDNILGSFYRKDIIHEGK